MCQMTSVLTAGTGFRSQFQNRKKCTFYLILSAVDSWLRRVPYLRQWAGSGRQQECDSIRCTPVCLISQHHGQLHPFASPWQPTSHACCGPIRGVGIRAPSQHCPSASARWLLYRETNSACWCWCSWGCGWGFHLRGFASYELY